MTKQGTPVGDPSREAIDSLRGYTYQIYQCALAWTEIENDEFLFLEVAEDYAIVANDALKAVQVKETTNRITINSEDVIASIDSFVNLQEKNPNLNVSLRHLTTSIITKEKNARHRIGDEPTLVAWRRIAKSGNLSTLRKIFENSKLSRNTKDFIKNLNDDDLRGQFLRKIHFDCGQPKTIFLERLIQNKVTSLLLQRGGSHKQSKSCISQIMLFLLKLSTEKSREKRFVDKARLEKLIDDATRINLSMTQFEEHQLLISKALSASIRNNEGVSKSQVLKPNPLSEDLLPNVLAERTNIISLLLQKLSNNGVSWISGTAGMGKTVAARILTFKSGGVWGSINLRELTSEQVGLTLSQLAENISDYSFEGIIIDDLNCSLEGSALDSLSYLTQAINRLDILLIVTSSNSPSSEFLFNNDLSSNISTTLTEFTPDDIKQILSKKGINDRGWAQYIHVVSGGGHPQLTIAIIQSLANSGWDRTEFQTLDSLLKESPEVSEIRKRVRERLLKELPDDSRKLIERLSLQVGGFNRDLAIDLGKVSPPIEHTGIVLDSLTGSWIDRHENNRFSLSPLLSDFANTTLTSGEKEEILSTIADSLTTGNIFNAVDMNSALIAATRSKNFKVILKVCLSLINADNEELEFLAPHLSLITLYRTDKIAFTDNAYISHLFRGVQLLLVNQEKNSPTNIKDVLRCFSNESKNVKEELQRSMTNLMVYSKLLLQNSKANIGSNFIGVIDTLDTLLENKNSVLPDEVLTGLESYHNENESIIGFMFLNQARQLSKIEDLTSLFDYIGNSSPELRSRLLSPLGRDDTGADMLVSGAWLNEHNNNSIDSSIHSSIFARLENQALEWGNIELAVSCRKFQAIILDEYGNSKNLALEVLDKGLKLYGMTNSELVRAKAKVLYRSSDHEGSLFLSKQLIESNAPLSEIEKAFLGRDAAISAEKQGYFEESRKYYLYGCEALNDQKTDDLEAIRVGLLADAALASWHNGDRYTFLQDFQIVLKEVNNITPGKTLQASHCHAFVRHVLLWINKEITGKDRLFEVGEETKIYPGCISNPEPHSEIINHPITPIEIAFYMLASVENYAEIDAGITKNLPQLLPSGPVLEGQVLLNTAKIYNAISNHNAAMLIESIRDLISYYVSMKSSPRGLKSFSIDSPTFSALPSLDLKDQEEHADLIEKFILLFFSMCVLKEDVRAFYNSLKKLLSSDQLYIKPVLLEQLKKGGLVSDYNTAFAQLINEHIISLQNPSAMAPIKVFELAFKTIQVAKVTDNFEQFTIALLPWLEKRLEFFWKSQRFLLINPDLYKPKIEAVLKEQNISTQTKVIKLMSAILPTLEITNRSEVIGMLKEL